MQIPLILTENNFQTPFLFGPPSPQLSVGHPTPPPHPPHPHFITILLSSPYYLELESTL